MAVRAIPEGLHSITPYLCVAGVPALIDFLKAAFDGTEQMRHLRPDGTVMHAQVRIGDSTLMIGEASGAFKAAPVSLYFYCENTDALYARAIAAGGVSVMEPADQIYGDRHGGVKDPSGNTWWIATHFEDVSNDEMARRMAVGAKSA